MTLKDSWSHFIFHICKCFLEFATRGKHDVRALDVFLENKASEAAPSHFRETLNVPRPSRVTRSPWARCSDRRLKTSSSTASIMPCGKKRRCSVTSFTSFLCETVSLPHTLRMLWASSCRTHFHRENVVFIIMTDCFHSWKPGSFLWRHPSRLCLYRPFRPSGWRLGLCGLLRIESGAGTKILKSSPGVNTMLTAVMLLSVNFFRSSAPSEPIEIQKLPNSASCTFCLPEAFLQGTRTYRLLHLYRSASEYAIVVGNVFDKLAEWHDFRNLSFCIRFWAASTSIGLPIINTL